MMAGFWAELQKWQTLVGAMVAVFAVCIAFANTTRSLRHTKQLEEQRRSRKHAAVRAVLPLALAQVSGYAEQSAHALNELVSRCDDEALPKGTAPENFVQPLPSETLKTLTDFIEYSDTLDVSIIESTVAWIQIHDSRLRALVKNNRDPSSSWIVVRSNLETSIIDAASIYAGAGAAYDYARRRGTQLPHMLPWEAVRGALRNMGLWDDQNPRLYESVQRHVALSAGPFERLNSQHAQASEKAG